MKKIDLLLGMVAAACLVSAGCSKSEKPPQAPTMNGVTVDVPKFNTAFENASMELKRQATEVTFNLRYQKYEEALMALDKLSNDPNLTADQKQATGLMLEEVKKLAGAGAAAAPAQ
jgi:outer membrane murein-binding lipoprotein Lpp